MRKIFLVFFIIISLYCQAQHFQFMGIPLDGDIEHFDSLLQKKGFIRSRNYHNEIISKTSYYYEGLFAGDTVVVSAIVNPKTNIINSARMTYFFDNEVSVQQKYLNYQNLIELLCQVKEINSKLAKNMIVYDCENGTIILDRFIGKNYKRVSIQFFDQINKDW